MAMFSRSNGEAKAAFPHLPTPHPPAGAPLAIHLWDAAPTNKPALTLSKSSQDFMGKHG